MIVSVKKKSTKFHNDKFHVAYGIQNWLCKMKFCLIGNAKYKVNKEQYENLLKEFVLFSNKDFDFNKNKDKIKSMENYVHYRFKEFCNFCMKKFKPKRTI